DFEAHEPAVDKAQGRVRLGVERERVKVRGIIAAHAQDPPALRLPRFHPPERQGMREGQGREHGAGREAGLEQIPTTHTRHDTEMSLRYVHTSLSFVRRTGGAASQVPSPDTRTDM